MQLLRTLLCECHYDWPSVRRQETKTLAADQIAHLWVMDRASQARRLISLVLARHTTVPKAHHLTIGLFSEWWEHGHRHYDGLGRGKPAA